MVKHMHSRLSGGQLKSLISTTEGCPYGYLWAVAVLLLLLAGTPVTAIELSQNASMPGVQADPTSRAIAARSFPQGDAYDTLWEKVFGYIRDHNSSQFTGPPSEALEDLERSNPDLDLLYLHGIYMASELRTGTSQTTDGKLHPLLRVCIVTSDVGVSFRVRARGPVLLLPSEKYQMVEQSSQRGVYRQCYGFDFFVPGLYGIEANVTYTKGSGMCAGCKRNELFMVPGYEVANTSMFQGVPQHVVDPELMGIGPEASAKKWSSMQWSGESPLYSGNRVQGTPFLLFVPSTLSSYERGEQLLHGNEIDTFYQMAWNDSSLWMSSLSPVISAAFSVEDHTSASTRCNDGSTNENCRRRTYSLPYCTYEDTLYGMPLWTDVRLLERSNGIIGTDGNPQRLQLLTPKLSINNDHGTFAVLQSKISLGQRCRGRRTSAQNTPGTINKWVDWRGWERELRHSQSYAVMDNLHKQYCVRRRWTQRQVVHRLQGEHVGMQGDSTMRCLFLQLLGYLDAQFHITIGWTSHLRGHEALPLAKQIQSYLECASDPRGTGATAEDDSYDYNDALWQRHHSPACLRLVPYVRTFTYDLNRLTATYFGPKWSGVVRGFWQGYMPARNLTLQKGRLSEVQREDVYICSRSLHPCKSNRLEWSFRSRLFEQYRQRHGNSPVDVDDFCCFEFPLKNAMKYVSGYTPQFTVPWDPIRVLSTDKDMRDALLSEFEYIDVDGSEAIMKEFAKSYFLLQVQSRVSFSFASGVKFSTHYHLHRSATRKVFTWGLGLVCGYSDVEVDALVNHFVDGVTETLQKGSPQLNRDKRYGHGAVFMNTPMRNRQKEFDRTGNSDASCSYYTNDRIARANAHMRAKYTQLPPELRVVEVDEMSDAFPEGILDGSHMCTATSGTCQESVGSILDALFMP